MALTITLTATQIAAIVYAVTVAMVGFSLYVESASYANRPTLAYTLMSVGWPVLLIQILILGPVFNVYIGTLIDDIKDWNEQRQCDHNSINMAGDYKINGRTPEKACNDCGKVWWEDEA